MAARRRSRILDAILARSGWSEPEKTKTLGRRSSETERIFADFVTRREETQRRAEALKSRIAMLGRAAAAMGLGRLPSTHTQHLRRLMRAGLLDDSCLRIVALGTPAFALYETLYHYLAPRRLLRHDGGDDATTFYVGSDEIEDVVADRLARALFTLKARVQISRHSPGCVSINTLDHSYVSYREVEFVARSAIERSLSDRNAKPTTVRTVFAVLDNLPLVKGLSVATDCSVLEYASLDPRAFALVSRLAANGGSSPQLDETVAFRRASAVAWMVRDGIIPLAFADAEEDALADLGYPNPMLGHDPTFNARMALKEDQKTENNSSSSIEDEEPDVLRGP